MEEFREQLAQVGVLINRMVLLVEVPRATLAAVVGDHLSSRRFPYPISLLASP